MSSLISARSQWWITACLKCLFPSWDRLTCDLAALACFDRSKHQRLVQRLSSDDSFRWYFFHMFNITWQLTTGYKGLKVSRCVYLVLYSLWVEERLHCSVSLNPGTLQDMRTRSETSLLNLLLSYLLYFYGCTEASLLSRNIFWVTWMRCLKLKLAQPLCAFSLEWRSLKLQKNAKIF